MLFFSLLLLVGGYTLVYAGLSHQPYWQAPWRPITDMLGIPGGPTL